MVKTILFDIDLFSAINGFSVQVSFRIQILTIFRQREERKSKKSTSHRLKFHPDQQTDFHSNTAMEPFSVIEQAVGIMQPAHEWAVRAKRGEERRGEVDYGGCC